MNTYQFGDISHPTKRLHFVEIVSIYVCTTDKILPFFEDQCMSVSMNVVIIIIVPFSSFYTQLIFFTSLLMKSCLFVRCCWMVYMCWKRLRQDKVTWIVDRIHSFGVRTISHPLLVVVLFCLFSKYMFSFFFIFRERDMIKVWNVNLENQCVFIYLLV